MKLNVIGLYPAEIFELKREAVSNNVIPDYEMLSAKCTLSDKVSVLFTLELVVVHRFYS